MRAIIETVFDIFYLAAVLTVGIRMIRGSKNDSQFKLFGLMAVVLGPAIPSTWYLVHWLCAPPAWRTTLFPWAWASGSPPSP